jgi:dTDP-4-dehydrorhamnose reductase
MKRVLLTGGSGQLGVALLQRIKAYQFDPIAPVRHDLDLTSISSIVSFLEGCSLSGIIHAGAYTKVDQAESEPELAQATNADATAVLAQIAARRRIPIIYVSTDYVFDGRASRPWRESDHPHPVNVYGATKAAGEAAIAASNARHVILRTSRIVSPWGQNFAKTMLRLATERDNLRIVGDQYGRMTSADDLAETICKMISRVLDDEGAETGVFHFANSGVSSWADLAREIFRLSRLRGGPFAHVENISSADYAAPALRPAYSVLDTERITDHYGIVPRSWQDALSDVIDALIPARVR